MMHNFQNKSSEIKHLVIIKLRFVESPTGSKYTASALNRVFNGLADHYYWYSDTSIFPVLRVYCNRLSSSESNPRTVFMFTNIEWETLLFGPCIEFFLYGKISESVPWALTCTVTLAKEIQLFPGPGVYSGIFAIYLQCPKKDSRTAKIVFYVLCLLYVLSTASVVCDLLSAILSTGVSNNSICNLRRICFFYQLCRVDHHFSLKLTHCQ